MIQPLTEPRATAPVDVDLTREAYDSLLADNQRYLRERNEAIQLRDSYKRLLDQALGRPVEPRMVQAEFDRLTRKSATLFNEDDIRGALEHVARERIRDLLNDEDAYVDTGLPKVVTFALEDATPRIRSVEIRATLFQSEEGGIGYEMTAVGSARR